MVARVQGVGLGELWYEKVRDGLTQRQAERRAQREPDLIAIPTPYDPTEEERSRFWDSEGNRTKRVDDYERGLQDA